MRKVYILLAAGILSLAGCAAVSRIVNPSVPELEEDPEASERVSAEQKEEVSSAEVRPISSAYDMDSLLLPVVQLDRFIRSFDYFPRFCESEDYIFPDYLFQIFYLPSPGFSSGEGAVLSGWNTDGKLVYQIERAYLGLSGDGGQMHQVKHWFFGKEIFYEVKTAVKGVPLVIRFQDPDTGEKKRVVPMIAMDYQRALEDNYGEELEMKIDGTMTYHLQEDKRNLFLQPEILGEEVISLKPGEFTAVHVRDNLPQDPGLSADYWLSPDIPGGIGRIIVRDQSGETVRRTELEAVTLGNVSGLE